MQGSYLATAEILTGWLGMRLKTLIVKTTKHVPPLFRLLSRLSHSLNTSFVPGNSGAPGAITDAMKRFRELEPNGNADYYGFGVYRGYTLWHAQQVATELGIRGMHFYGFDSFRGFPDIKGIDRVNKEFFKGQYAVPVEKTRQYLREHGADFETLHLIEGFYEKVLTEELRSRYPFRRAGVVFLDCDLYHSTLEALRWMTPYLADGTILLMDDWRTFGKSQELGQPKALDDFLREHPEFRLGDLGEFPNNGRAFVLRVRPSEPSGALQ